MWRPHQPRKNQPAPWVFQRISQRSSHKNPRRSRMNSRHAPPSPALSVIICTRNPKPLVLRRVLEYLSGQTLPHARWEAILVDNGSEPPVAIPADWQQPGRLRIVVEPTPGLTAARLRGIREAHGDLVVFVDDDNLLDPDYLAEAVRLAAAWPQIGVFGGRISPEFEAAEPDWLQAFRSHLALADFERDEWANILSDGAVIPCGAGLCVRRPLAERWAARVAADPRRLALDRSGESTMSCGDTDLVFSCLDEGWGSARFTALHLTHVIPASRLDYAYQRRLARDIGYSYGRLLAIRSENSCGRRAIAAVKTALAWAGVKHRGNARVLDYEYHRGYWRGLS